MKIKNYIFIILVVFIAASIVYYSVLEYIDMQQERDGYQTVYRQSDRDYGTESLDESIKEVIIKEVMKEFRAESGKQTFSDDDLIKLHRSR